MFGSWTWAGEHSDLGGTGTMRQASGMTAVGSMKHLALGATSDGAKLMDLKNKFPCKKPQMADFKLL